MNEFNLIKNDSDISFQNISKNIIKSLPSINFDQFISRKNENKH